MEQKQTNETLPLAARSLIEEAVGSVITGCRQIRQGRNSRVDIIVLHNGQRFVLKRYAAMNSTQRDRLGTEFQAFSLLRANGIDVVPAPLLMNREHRLGLYEYIAGELPGPPTSAEVEAMLGFMGRLLDLGTTGTAQKMAISSASEACFSLTDIAASLQRRMARLEGAVDATSMGKKLAEFLERLRNASDTWIGDAKKRLAASSRILSKRERILSPSDFGLHNAVRRASGELAFLDFEYFGWDDPAKLMADTALHPAMVLPDALGCAFARGMVSLIAPSDRVLQAKLSQRAIACFPLWGCKWCCILLNEFLETQCWRRFFSGAESDKVQNPNAIRARQLAKAQNLLGQLYTDNAMARWLESKIQ